ncbi:MAG: hypothetical protein MUC43_20325, partial [Pirellula sp.]|nr:hypothetical protein [Pirellula sp.]
DIALSYHMGIPFSAGLKTPATHFSASRVPAELTSAITRHARVKPPSQKRPIACSACMALFVQLFCYSRLEGGRVQ